jgi:Flp pilus assembly protein TadG
VSSPGIRGWRARKRPLPNTALARDQVHAAKVAEARAKLPWRRIRKDQRGAVIVEFAILSPVLIGLVVGGIDLTLSCVAEQQLSYAVQGAAFCRAAAGPQCNSDPAAGQWGARQATLASGSVLVA